MIFLNAVISSGDCYIDYFRVFYINKHSSYKQRQFYFFFLVMHFLFLALLQLLGCPVRCD